MRDNDDELQLDDAKPSNSGAAATAEQKQDKTKEEQEEDERTAKRIAKWHTNFTAFVATWKAFKISFSMNPMLTVIFALYFTIPDVYFVLTTIDAQAALYSQMMRSAATPEYQQGFLQEWKLIPPLLLGAFSGDSNSVRQLYHHAVHSTYLAPLAYALFMPWVVDMCRHVFFLSRDRVERFFQRKSHIAFSTAIVRKTAELDLLSFEDPEIAKKRDLLEKMSHVPFETLKMVCQYGIQIAIVIRALFSLSAETNFLYPLLQALTCVPELILNVMRNDWKWQQDRRLWTLKARSQYYESTLKDVKSKPEITVYQLSDYLLAKWMRTSNRAESLEGYQDLVWNLMNLPAYMLRTILARVLFAWLVVMKMQSFSDFANFAAGLKRVTDLQGEFNWRLQDMFGVMSNMHQYRKALDEFTNYINLKPKMKVSANPVPFPKSSHSGVSIQFQNVSFTYPSGKVVFRNLNCEINEGETIALIGRNGAGKTTFLKLLTRLYPPTSGVIKMNGIDISEIETSEFYSKISTIFQPFMIFELSIAENIGLGDLRAEQHKSQSRSSAFLSWMNPFSFQTALSLLDFKLSSQRRKAAHFSGAAEFIEKTPRKYDTLISSKFKGGINLSGGQMQKLAISRAATRIIKNPPCGLLILDEPVGAIDGNGDGIY
eukprot:TRINITY_DN4534_c0_g1_i1.p1 TRINITY_DN4534_c0_g1~~TRINITY_DN4534_c0_g1_i1.p1  ORF type:complete len:696 (+),score=180.34 TRINITY_DN4534_c0_g1_i1:120-2090(+)